METRTWLCSATVVTHLFQTKTDKNITLQWGGGEQEVVMKKQTRSGYTLKKTT